MNALGEFLKGRRLAKRKSQQQIANAIHTHKTLVSYYELGRRIPHKTFLFNLMNALDITNEELVELKEEYISYIIDNIQDFNLLELVKIASKLKT